MTPAASIPTGARRVRAGLPEKWASGDKTGTSGWMGTNRLYVDIGYVEPPERPPLTFATYLRSRDGRDGMAPEAEAALAKVGRVLATMAERPDWFPF